MFQRVVTRRTSIATPYALTTLPLEPASAPAVKRSRSIEDPRKKAFTSAASVLKRSSSAVTELLGQVRLGKALDSKLILPVVADVQKSVEESTSALISLTRIRNKDEFTYIHSVAVCALMVNLGRELGLSPSAVEELGVAGLLHDVGKMVIPDHVLNKPGKLTCEETTIMRSHAQRGYELLKQAGNLPEVALDVCLSHHEKIDGTGYPQRIAGERISWPLGWVRFATCTMRCQQIVPIRKLGRRPRACARCSAGKVTLTRAYCLTSSEVSAFTQLARS